MIGTHPQAVVFHHQNAGNTEGAAVPRPRKYHTEEERREAARQSQRKYVANREAVKARHAERNRKRREAIKAGQKET
jgi:IS5 family transposase